jgi:hypothetical protein
MHKVMLTCGLQTMVYMSALKGQKEIKEKGLLR